MASKVLKEMKQVEKAVKSEVKDAKKEIKEDKAALKDAKESGASKKEIKELKKELKSDKQAAQKANKVLGEVKDTRQQVQGEVGFLGNDSKLSRGTVRASQRVSQKADNLLTDVQKKERHDERVSKLPDLVTDAITQKMSGGLGLG